MRKPALLFLLILGAAASAWAQATPFKVTVSAPFPEVRFRVDGVLYYGNATFFWVENSQHFLQFESSKDGFQYLGGGGPLATTRYVFRGWLDLTGTVQLDSGITQTVFAHPKVTDIRLDVTREFLARLNFWDAPPPPDQADGGVCAADKTGGPGVVFVGETCFYRNVDVWLPEGLLQLAAYPFGGWAFAGFAVNGAPPELNLSQVLVQGPQVITVHFRPAKRVKFLTEPRGLELLIDRMPLRTPFSDTCQPQDYLPLGPLPGGPRRCAGEMDWLAGSRHVIGAESPQTDSLGQVWVFHSFSNGMENNSVYEVTSLHPPETLVAKFVRGARVSFVTQPSGLKLTIDGRDNWLSYNFVVAPGKVFNVSAPSEQVDSNGRKWVFAGWSNGGEQTQEVTIPEEAADKGYRLTAHYDILSQVWIDTAPLRIPVDVDGAPCETPCSVDRPDGTEVTVSARDRHSINHAHRVEFQGWDDGGELTRTVKLTGKDRISLRANYRKMYLLDTQSVPADGVDFVLDPQSPDAFYQDGTSVGITAKAREGFRFRRWEGDLQGTVSSARLQMSRPRTAIAMLDAIETAPPAWVQNAAGPTPETVVAPGSLISIYGSTLALHFHVGPSNPLAQTLLGTTVRVDNRILALQFVSPDQINAVLHPDTPEGRHKLIVSRPGELDIETEIEVRRNAPGLFSRVYDARYFLMASHEDGRPVTPDDPPAQGATITIYGTGFGPYDKIAPYGFAFPAAPPFALADPIEVLAGGAPVAIEFAGGAEGFAGTDMIRMKIPPEVPAASTVELKVRIHGRESNVVLLPVK